MTAIDLDARCKHCGLTFGSHRATDGRCPGHEGRMDYDEGPGTSFVLDTQPPPS